MGDSEDILATIVECTPEEARELSTVDLKKPEDITARQRAMLAELDEYEKQIARKRQKVAPGKRETSARVQAREMVALRHGLSVEAIRKAEYRARKAGIIERTSSVKVFGVPPSKALLERIDGAMEKTSALRAAIRSALRVVASSNLPDKQRSRITALLDRTLDFCGAPYAVCPWCKGIEKLSPNCAGCSGAGWVTRERIDFAPQELLATEKPLVAVDGDFLPAEEFAEPPPTETEELF
jgi:hypothetical protein